MQVRLNSCMFSIITRLIMNSYWKEYNCFEILIYNRTIIRFFMLACLIKSRWAAKTQSRIQWYHLYFSFLFGLLVCNEILKKTVFVYCITYHTGLPTKDETSETIVRNFVSSVFLHYGIFIAVGQNWLTTVLNYQISHQNT